jgi:alkylmercury lyase
VTINAPITIEELNTNLAEAMAIISLDEQRLAVAIYRLLALGQPVPINRAATKVALPVGEAERMVGSWPAVFFDEQHRIVGFWGLALQPMAHGLRVGGADLFTWCAWDPFFLARIIGDLDVSTDDPITGQAITYHLGSDGVVIDLSHHDSVLSFLRPDQPWDDNVMTTFCHFVNQFTGPEPAQQWVAGHPGTFIIGLDDAVELARHHVGRFFGSALQSGDTPAS